MITVSNKMKVGIASRDILNLIQKHMKFLCKKENLPALAYMLWKWDRLAHAGRWYDDESEPSIDEETCSKEEWAEWEDYYEKGASACENNPKYEIQDHLTYPNTETEDLLYGAWGISVANEDYGSERYADFYKDEVKRVESYSPANMTFEDWMKVQDDTDGFQTRDWLFFSYGTGIEIDKNGYLTDAGASDIPDHFYNGWAHMKDKLPAKVADKFWEIVNRPECKETLEHAVKQIRVHERERIIKENKYRIGDMKKALKKNPDLMVIDIRADELLKKSDDEIIVKSIQAEFHALSLLSKEELDELEAKETAERKAFIKEHFNADCFEGHVSYAVKYSHIGNYAKLHECYRPHLIQAAREFIETPMHRFNGEEPNKYQISEHKKMVTICKKVLKHFGEK
jgi:hypothetical protein